MVLTHTVEARALRDTAPINMWTAMYESYMHLVLRGAHALRDLDVAVAKLLGLQHVFVAQRRQRSALPQAQDNPR